MAGGASLADYNNAYAKVHKGGEGVIPSSAIAGTEAIRLRAAGSEATERKFEHGKVDRAREVSDLMWKMNDHRNNLRLWHEIKGATKTQKGDSIRCPHCGSINPL